MRNVCNTYGALQGAVSYEYYAFCVLNMAPGALQGAVSYKECVFCVLNRSYGALQGAVSVAEFLLPTVLLTATSGY